MLLCLDNAIAAGDEMEEEEIPLIPPTGEDFTSLFLATSSHSSGKDEILSITGGSPIHSGLAKHRSARVSGGTRHRHTTETVVSSSEMDASDNWEKESGVINAESPMKEKTKEKSPKKN